MPSKRKPLEDPAFIREWTLPAAATLGSSVRAKGILLEMRARLAPTSKKFLDVTGNVLALRMAEDQQAAFNAATAIVSKGLDSIETLPVIPREIEDILSITATERHRWLGDGRLKSAGTRTVRLAGRAKKITFHVFEPRQVEEIINEDLVSVWREDDVIAREENRRQRLWKARLVREEKKAAAKKPASEPGPDDAEKPQLAGWAEFERDGLLR